MLHAFGEPDEDGIVHLIVRASDNKRWAYRRKALSRAATSTVNKFNKETTELIKNLTNSAPRKKFGSRG